MATLNRVLMIQNNDVKSRPFMYTTFRLIYINDEDYAYTIGGENGSNYYLMDNNGQLYGQLKTQDDAFNCYNVININTQLINNNKLCNELNNLLNKDVVIIGEFEIKRIVLWGTNNSKFSIQGLPTLHNTYTVNNNTIAIQNNIP